MATARRIHLALTAVAAAGLLSTAAHAQTGVGAATSIERDVSGVLSGRTRSMATGDSVFANETIRTANASAAKLRFRDNTDISIGPSASVVLDRFVFNPDGGARAATARVTQGALRWVSGSSNPQAYTVRTPHAVIGVRGTAFDVLVAGGRTDVTLIEGQITVCAIAAPRDCAVLSVAGQTVAVTRRGVDGVRPNGLRATEFAARCLSPVDRAACGLDARADLAPAPAPAPVWTGFYVGGHGGFGRSQSTAAFDGSPAVQASIGFNNVPARLSASGGSALGGVQAGYNLQAGQFVFGVETDIAYTRLGGRSQFVATIPFFGINPTTTVEQRLNYLGTVRGRVGVAFDRLLIFGTGGLAYGGVNLDASIIPVPIAAPVGPFPTYVNRRSQTRAGWALGAGFEYALTPMVSLKLDYLHYDLGRQSMLMPETTGAAPGEFATVRAPARGDIVRAGFNMKF